jgi:hypothetical protein
MQTFFQDSLIAEEVCRLVDRLINEHNVPWEQIKIVPNNRGNFVIFYRAASKMR